MGQNCEIWPQFLTPLAFEPPAFSNRAMYLKSKTNSVSNLCPLKFGEVWFTHPWELSADLGWMAKCGKSSLTQPRIVRFRSDSIQTMITWHVYHKLSRWKRSKVKVTALR